MSEIKITGADWITASQTRDASAGVKIIYSLSNLPSENWRSEFNLLAQENPLLSRAIRAIEFGGTKIIIECAADIAPATLNQAVEEVVRQTNRRTGSSQQELQDERGADSLIER